MKIKYNNGITLVALVITVVILLILASVTIAALSGDNGILNNASLAKVSTEFANYKEEVEMYKMNKLMEDYDFEEDTLTAGQTTLTYENKPDDETGNIKTIITDLDDKYLSKFIIIKGNLYLMAVGDTSDVEIKAAEATGIEVMPYEITEEGELLSSNKNLALQGGDGGVVIPEIVTSIGSGAFSGVEGLKEVTIPGTVKKIGSDAFSYNNTLETVIIENGVEEIGNYAFKGCSNLKTVIMADSVTNTGSQVFRSCSSLEEVKLSNNITVLKDYSFASCGKLATINLPSNLAKIESSCFEGCYLLNNIELGKNVTEIGPSAFSNCTNLYNLTVNKSNENFIVINNILYSGDKKQIKTLLAGIKNASNLVIEEGVEEIVGGLFSVCEKMESISLPSTLKSIGGAAFYGVATLENINIPTTNQSYKVQDNMILSKDGTEFIYATPNREEIIIPEGVKIVRSQSIHGSKIKSVKFENDVTNLEAIVFRDCSNLQNIWFGKNVNYINPNFKAWGGITKNLTLTINSENEYYKVLDNYIVSKDEKTLILYINVINDFELPEGIEIIGDASFIAANIETIKLPSTLKKIGVSAFTYNSVMTEIDIPSSVETIGNNAFGNCSNLSAINIDKPENSITGSPWDAPKGLRIVNWNG